MCFVRIRCDSDPAAATAVVAGLISYLQPPGCMRNPNDEPHVRIVTDS